MTWAHTAIMPRKRVIEANAALIDDPALVNSDPLGKGWFVKLRVKDKGELGALLDEAAYAKYVAGLG